MFTSEKNYNKKFSKEPSAISSLSKSLKDVFFGRTNKRDLSKFFPNNLYEYNAVTIEFTTVTSFLLAYNKFIMKGKVRE